MYLYLKERGLIRRLMDGCSNGWRWDDVYRFWWPHRVLLIRAIRGYRTVSTEVACGLVGTPLWDLVAEVLAEVNRRAAELWAENGFHRPPEVVHEWCEAARWTTIDPARRCTRWLRRCGGPLTGHPLVLARYPFLPTDVGPFRAPLLREIPTLGC